MECKRNTEILLTLFRGLIAAGTGARTFDEVPITYTPIGRMANYDGYFARLKRIGPSEKFSDSGSLIVYHSHRHSGNFGDGGSRLLITANNCREGVNDEPDLICHPSPEEMDLFVADDKKVFLEVLARLSTLASAGRVLV